METAFASVVFDNGHATFWTVPERFMYAHELIVVAKLVPLRDPLLQDLPCFTIAQGHLFHAVDLQAGTVEHLLNSSTCALEHRKGNHLVEA